MKKILTLFLIILAGIVMHPLQSFAQNTVENPLMVYYFHNTHRCATCNAIETKTRETLETNFKEMMDSGEIKLLLLNAEDDENKSIVEKYEIWGSTLMLVKVVEGKEQVENFTDFAFSNARTHPDKFMEGLKSNIEKMLN
ncbi:MAG: thioredoxin [Bacteroidetes bacterium]|nr:thioredoxin [Bacteroidota bacterium]